MGLAHARPHGTPGPPVAAESAGEVSRPPARSLDLADLGILAYALGMLVLWSPGLYAGLVTPRTALLLVGLGPGLVVLAGLARRGDPVARWAGGYLGWAVLAALASGQPRIAVLGSYSSDLGWIYLAGYVAAAGLGRRLGQHGRRLLPGVLLAGVTVNAVAAVAEAAFEPTGILQVRAGRVAGLTPNCLFLGGLLAGGLVLGGWMIGRGRRWQWGLPGIVLFATATNLTGSRAALVGGGVLTLVACFHSARRSTIAAAPIRRTLLVTVALAAGVLLAVPLQPSSSAGTDRLTASSGGYTSRFEMWSAGLHAAAERPVVGWGPGRFRAAVDTRTTARFVRAEGPDQVFYDAHNLVVEQLVTTGVPGLVLVAGFAVALARRARGPLAWFAVGVATTWMFTPVSISTAPVVLLAMGAAWRPSHPDGDPPPGRAQPTVARGRPLAVGIGAVLALAGLVAGARLVAADAIIDDAAAVGDPIGVRRAERLLPSDAVLADLESSAWRVEADLGLDPSAGARAVAASRRAVNLDPTRSTWWYELGKAQAGYGSGTKAERLDAAERSFRAALRRNPWSVQALVGLQQVAELRLDPVAAHAWRAKICSVVACRPG